jgi:crotonobetainyl-CoA:carnitine CoA-transferase CaiB-like acyl-CoA transferase
MHDGCRVYYIQQNCGKKSLCIDVKKPGGLEILKVLVGTVDVLVENFSPGVISRHGLD